MKFQIIIFLMMFFQCVFAQETLKTTTKASEVMALFSQKSSVEWAVPISQTEKLTLQWSERKTSLSKKDGVRTFVAYQDGNLVASLSIHKNSVSAEVKGLENNIHISTDKQGVLMLHFNKEDSKCGICKDSSCSEHSKFKQKSPILAKNNTNSPKIDNSEVVLVYRLALPISYSSFTNSSGIFKNNVDNVRTFWANTELFLNEIYMRDLGVRFQIVDDENLIIKEKSNENLFVATSPSLHQSTFNINKLIGENNYDLGLAIVSAYRGSAIGLATPYGAYHTSEKGKAWSIPDFETIAHEIGHLFGSLHTFSEGGGGSYYTETGRGQSIMGYGKKPDFFSLVSIYYMRNGISQVSYYEDMERKTLVNRNGNYTNYPYGIKIPNQSPIINPSKLKKEYTIPPYTHFQFNIDATDTDNQNLLYMAHPANIGREGTAKFYTYKPTSTNQLRFEPLYTDEGKVLPHTDLVSNADAVFWLGVSDGSLKEDRAVMYDLFETKVKAVFGTPFEILDLNQMIKKEYKVGEKVTLKWRVDNQIFGTNSKVRILLSDDLGKTYKYTIIDSTENDGEYELTIPNILIGETEFGKITKTSLPAGVFKVEVIDHIAYAITNVKPFRDLGNVKIPLGGFKIVEADSTISPLKFAELPENVTVSCKKDIPEVPTLKATGSCNPQVTYNGETRTAENCNYTITRTWTATNSCGESISHKQTIIVRDDKAPTFNEDLPQSEITVNEGSIPEPVKLTAKDNCTANVRVEQTKEDTTENGKRVITYKWNATDDCGNIAEHTQRIKVEKGLSAITHIVDNANKPLLYPNPVSNVFYLNNIKDVVSVSIYNEEGRLIKTFEKSQSSYDVSNLKTGNYILRVHTKNENINIKWIKL